MTADERYIVHVFEETWAGSGRSKERLVVSYGPATKEQAEEYVAAHPPKVTEDGRTIRLQAERLIPNVQWEESS